jgi:hypothetical protein
VRVYRPLRISSRASSIRWSPSIVIQSADASILTTSHWQAQLEIRPVKSASAYPPASPPNAASRSESPPGVEAIEAIEVFARARIARATDADRGVSSPVAATVLKCREESGEESWSVTPQRIERPPPAVEINSVIGRNRDPTCTLAYTRTQ